jgi:hypothetical protein
MEWWSHFNAMSDEFHAELWSVNSDASEEHLLISKDEFNSYDRYKWLEESEIPSAVSF